MLEITVHTCNFTGGHDELVELLLAQGSNIEHRDKKGIIGASLSKPHIDRDNAPHRGDCFMFLYVTCVQ